MNQQEIAEMIKEALDTKPFHKFITEELKIGFHKKYPSGVIKDYSRVNGQQYSAVKTTLKWVLKELTVGVGNVKS